MNVTLVKTAKLLFAASDLARSRRPGPRILIYHQIGVDLGRQMEISESMFVQQLNWMDRHGTIVTLDKALTHRDSSSADQLFTLGFDDGYADLFSIAFPIMLERQIPFTLYLTTAPVESRQPLTPGGQAEPLDWDQINTMLGSGLVTMGAHTHGHVDLRGLPATQIEDELDTSNRLIEENTSVTARHFAYPKGYWSRDAEPLVRARYDSAVLGGGPPVTENTDLFRLHRIPVQRSDGFFFFKRKLLTGMPVEEWVRRRIKGYVGPT